MLENLVFAGDGRVPSQKSEILFFWSNDVLNREEEMKLSENRFPKTESLPAKSKSKKMLTGHDYILGKG